MNKEIKHKPQKAHFDFIASKIPFLACLSETELALLKNTIIEKDFLKNQIIMHEADALDYFYFVYSGKVKAVQISSEGQEMILAIHKRGDYFGEMAMLDGMTAPATIVAIENTRVGFISKKDFENHLLQNRKALMEIVSLLCSRLREAWLMLKVKSFADAEQRIRMVLINVGNQFGVKDPRGTIINIKLTHKDIAELATTARETVTRSISRFLQSGEIEILEKKYILLKSEFMKKVELI